VAVIEAVYQRFSEDEEVQGPPSDTSASVGAGGGGRMMYLLRINAKHKG